MPNQLTHNVLSWVTDLDHKTLEQAKRSASLPFIAGHVALMPDAHFGYGATVGSVIPTTGAIIPSAVGVDIGCGMIAARLGITASDLPDDLTKLHSMIARDVPSGVGRGHAVGAGPAGDPDHARPRIAVPQEQVLGGRDDPAARRTGRRRPSRRVVAPGAAPRVALTG
jgi:tRNA-splicing ligase RtcB